MEETTHDGLSAGGFSLGGEGAVTDITYSNKQLSHHLSITTRHGHHTIIVLIGCLVTHSQTHLTLL